MTTFSNRPNGALLVIDVQNGVVAGAYDRDAVVANIAELVEKARAAELDVVWVQHHSDNLRRGSDVWQYVAELAVVGAQHHADTLRRGSDVWQYVAELAPADGEPVVHKAYPDSFEDTEL